MEKTARLLRTGPPKEDESLLGYVTRLTELNAYHKASLVLNLADLPRVKFSAHTCPLVFQSPERLEGLSRLTGVSLKKMAGLVYPRARTSGRLPFHQFYEASVHQYLIRPLTLKICPECLRESTHCRRVWELSLVTACPKHLLRLIEECPRCGKRLPYLRNRVSVCPCEFDWRECPATPVPEAEAALSRHIYTLCGLEVGAGGTAGVSRSVGQFPAAALGLQDLISAVVFIAGQYQGLSGATGKKLAPAMNNEELHALYVRAYSVFENWPNNYYEFLDWRRARERESPGARNKSQTGLGRDFGNFYGGLYRYFSTGAFDFLRDGFGHYLVSRWEGKFVPSVNRWKLPRPLRGGDRYVSRFEARRLLGLNYEQIDHFIGMGKLKASVLNGGRKRLFLVEVSSLAALKRELERS